MTINISEIPVSERFALSDTDKQGNTDYEGRVDRNGVWYIKKTQSGSHRYVAGLDNYDTNWSNRASLTYVRYDEIFTT